MSKLFLVPTPIGNLEDITLRALNVLKEADRILTEDTRKTKILLTHYKISGALYPFHKFNEHRVLENIVNDIKSGRSAALVTDAGTPGISDPGFLLVRECLKHDIEIDCLPGATALIPALVMSGFPSDRFCFEGFLPHKKGRLKRLNELKEEKRTLIFYESPYRLIKTLTQLAEVFGEGRKASVSKELSKIYQSTFRGNLAEMVCFFEKNNPKGEFVIVVEGKI